MEDNDGYNDIPQDMSKQLVRRSTDRSANSDTDSTEAEVPWLQGNIPSASTSCQRYSNEVSFLTFGYKAHTNILIRYNLSVPALTMVYDQVTYSCYIAIVDIVC